MIDLMNCTDAVAEQTFLDEMNAKAKAMGLVDTDFIRADGWAYEGNFTTTDEYVRIIATAVNYRRTAEAFGCPQKTVWVSGENPRELPMTSTVVVGKDDSASVLRRDFWLLGGKTGTLSKYAQVYNLGLNLEDKKTGTRITVVGIGDTPDEPGSNRFTRVRALADIGMLLVNAGESNISCSDDIRDPECKAKVKEIEQKLSAGCVAGTVILTPQNAAYEYSNYTGEANSRFIYSYNGKKKVLQASLAKVMTCMLLEDWVSDWNETFTLIPGDIKLGCSVVTQAGDTITFADSLYLMMLPSSNDVACAIARVIGHKMYAVKHRA